MIYRSYLATNKIKIKKNINKDTYGKINIFVSNT